MNVQLNRRKSRQLVARWDVRALETKTFFLLWLNLGKLTRMNWSYIFPKLARIFNMMSITTIICLVFLLKTGTEKVVYILYILVLVGRYTTIYPPQPRAKNYLGQPAVPSVIFCPRFQGYIVVYRGLFFFTPE